MSNPTHSVPVDVTNPGQFYACCGLLELATALHPGREITGHFAGGAFALSVPPTEVLGRLAADPLEVVPLPEGSARIRGGAAHKVAPLRVCGVLTLDWWLDESSADFKTWAGGMVAPDSAKAFQAALAVCDLADAPFDATAATDSAAFCFDCRLGGDVIDTGGAGVGLRWLKYPAVDLLAFIGLQRCRPAGPGRRVKHYATWAEPLPITLAAAAAAGAVGPLSGRFYQFRLEARDASYRYKSFGRAVPFQPKETRP